LSEELREHIVRDPGFGRRVPEEIARTLELAAVERAGDAHLEDGECAPASGFYALALRVLALLKDESMSPSDRRRKRIELRLRLGDAALGASEARAASGSYAAALREVGVFAKKRSKREDENEEEEDGKDDDANGGRSRKVTDSMETEETYEDGGDEPEANEEKVKVAAEFIKKCNESSSKSSIKGLVDAEVLYRVGEACQLAGRPRRGLLAYRVALELQPQGPEERSATQIHLACGELAMRSDMPELALTYFRMVMKKPQEASLGTGDVLIEIAECYRVLKMPDEEERTMKSVCDNPDHKPIRITNVIKVAMYEYTRTRDSGKALHTLLAVNEMKETAESLYAMGRIHALERDFDAADDCLIRACELDPTSPKIWLEIGNIYLKGYNNPAVALKAFGRAKELALLTIEQEDSVCAESGYGGAAENRTKFKDSEELFDTRDEAVIGRGDALADLGQVAMALREYEEIPETAKVQIRKLRIIAWAVILVQRKYREYKNRVHGELAKGVRRPALGPHSALVTPTSHEVADEHGAISEKRRVSAKPTSQKYDRVTTRIVNKPEKTSEKKAMDMMKAFTIKSANKVLQEYKERQKRSPMLTRLARGK